MKQELPTGYYLDNFKLIIDYVAAQYGETLNDRELEFYHAFDALSCSAQRLYVRLISRQGPLFRSDKLTYREIPDIADAAQTLADVHFLSINPSIAIEQLAELLTKPELSRAFDAELAQVQKSRKVEQVEVLSNIFGIEPFPLSTLFPSASFAIYEPLFLDVVQVYRLLFFGNLRQDLTEFELLDLGHYRYEAYSVNPNDNIFIDRDIIEQYFLLEELSDLFRTAHEEMDISGFEQILSQLPNRLSHVRLEHKRCRLTNAIAHEFERANQLKKALDLFAQSSIPAARERRIRMLAKLGRKQEALSLCDQILHQPIDEDELEFANRFRLKLDKQLQREAKPHWQTTELVLPYEGRKSELVALDYYSDRGYDAYYVENTLMLDLFGLAFWDIIFMPVPGAFFNKYQRGPADLFTQEFRKKRECAIQQRLTEVPKRDNWTQEILETFREKHGINNNLVHWTALDEALLTDACELIPKEHLITLFDRLSFDLRNNRSGFPDLILFDKAKAEYLWAEVKGPGDRLQNNQKRWLRVFETAEIPYQVVHIRWQS